MNSHQFMLKPCNPCPDITTHQKRQSSLLSDRCDFKTSQNIFLEIKKKKILVCLRMFVACV
jgi:hypothetical protein